MCIYVYRCVTTFVLAPQIPQEEGQVTVAGRLQSFHPALPSRAVHCRQGVAPLSGSFEHQGEGELSVRLGAPYSTPLQHDDPQQVSVGRALLVEEQVGLQDEPAPLVRSVSLFLWRRREIVEVDEYKMKRFHVGSVFSEPFCRDIPLYQPGRGTTGSGSESSHGASSSQLKDSFTFNTSNPTEQRDLEQLEPSR